RTSTFGTNPPPPELLLKKAAGIKSGSGKPNKDKVCKISRAQLQEIAQTKAADMTAPPARWRYGCARSSLLAKLLTQNALTA
ncbi:hypothetical protein O5824_27790, partial [Escherichia coli]|nr:hypothetical protein [Escherichia coli]